jgi:hypothetical protein
MRKKLKKQSESLRIAKLKHDKWLRSMGAHKDQRSCNVVDQRSAIPTFTIHKSPWEQDMGPGEEQPETSGTHKHTKWEPGTKKQTMRYSGKRRLLGIATLHKSNLVPVFEKEELKAIGHMRR